MEYFNDTTTAASYTEVPLFVSYLKMITLLLAPFVLAIPTGLVLRVIVREHSLHTKYYFLVGNLLATDYLAQNLLQITGLVMHVAGFQVELSCTLIKLFETPGLASQLLFATLGIDRFIISVPSSQVYDKQTRRGCYCCCLGNGDCCHLNLNIWSTIQIFASIC